jgi:hypothetical protein
MGSETEGGGDGDTRRKMEIKGQRNVQWNETYGYFRVIRRCGLNLLRVFQRESFKYNFFPGNSGRITHSAQVIRCAIRECAL